MPDQPKRNHRFVVIVDDTLTSGHLFGDLRLEREPGEWMTIERRCRLCNRLPIELLSMNAGILPKCEGVRIHG